MLNKNAKLDPNIFTMKLETMSTRDGYGMGLLKAGEENENVVALAADLTESTRTQLFAQKFPKRYFEVGVAEQNMIGIAAGLALSGKIPFAASFGVFNPGRNWEQIRVSVGYSNTNVKIVGSHTGFSNGPDGATHQALEDIALTRVLPNMTVINPCDSLQAEKATIASANYLGPVYLRLARNKTPVFTTEETPFEIGKATKFFNGDDLTIISSGPILYEVIKAAHKITEKYKITVDVLNLSTIKPLDEKAILKSAEKTRKVLTVEEHQKAGGLGSAVAELLGQNLPVPIYIMGVDDTFGESGQPSELVEKYELSEEHIQVKIKELCL